MRDELLTLMHEKLAFLEKALVLETDAAVKFKLKTEIDELNHAITGRQTHTNVVLDSSVVHLKVHRLFVGRDDELVCLAKALENQQMVTVTAVIEGMGGVGKSYLVDRFAVLSPHYRYKVLSLNPLAEETVENLLAQLAEWLQIRPVVAELRAQLQQQNVLLHLENVDTVEMSKVAMKLVAQLQGCRLVLSGRLKGLGRGGIFERIELNVFDLEEGIQQLKQELEDLEVVLPSDAVLQKLVEALEGLPLALHLCAGYLAENESFCATAEDFLRELKASKLRLESGLALDAANRNPQHCSLYAAFSVSFLAFARQCPAQATALNALGFCYARDVGFSLACALLNVSPEVAKTVLQHASKLGLLTKIRGQGDIDTLRWQIHPLIAEYLRTEATDSAAIEQRLTDWFMQRLPEPATEAGYQAWHELNQEQDALRAWLERVSLEQGQTIVQTGSWYADINGSWTSWRQFCEKLLATPLTDEARSGVLWTACRCSENLGDLNFAYQFAEQNVQLNQRLGNERGYALARGQIADILYQRGELNDALRIHKEEVLSACEHLGEVKGRAVTLGKIADILQARGELDEALRIWQKELIPVFERLDDVRSRTMTLGKIADILQARGELDEALRIHQQEQMPIYERQGDMRMRAVALGKIADILQARGELDEALWIRQEEEMPVYERLGDVRERAVTLGKIADILQMRGELDEALRILQKELILVFERLGDVRSRAGCFSRIADILQARGELDEALRIYQQEEMPIYERLGDVRARAFCFGRISDILQARGELDEALRIRQQEEMPVYERLGNVRERAVCFGRIADILQARGELDEALRIRQQEEMPVYERLGDLRGLLITQWKIASIFMKQTPPRRTEANQLLCQALQAARKMRIPEAEQIEEYLQYFEMECLD